MIILIIFGLLQALILPGLICVYFIKNLDFFSRLILASTLSLVINYVFVWILYTLKIYSQISFLFIFIIEILFILKFQKKIYKDFFDLYNFCLNSIKEILLTKSISFVKLIFIIYCIWYFILFRNNGYLTVFTHWDAVVSWNRWALELHEGTFQGSRGYPLAISILFSIVYTFAKETNIQTFVKLICVYWPFLGGLSFFGCGLFYPKSKQIFAIASLIYLFLLINGTGTTDFIFSGLVDPIMASYGAIFIFSILCIVSNSFQNNLQYKSIIGLFIISIAGSALIKMTGVILTIQFLFLIFIVRDTIKNPFEYKLSYVFFVLFAFLFIIHWYVLTTFYWRDWQVLSEYSSLQDPRIWIRPYLHLGLFKIAFGWPLLFLILIGSISSFYGFICAIFIVLPLFLFSAIVVGYDLRASFILFGPMSVIAGSGLVQLYRFFIYLYRKFSFTYKVNLIKNKFINLIFSIFLVFLVISLISFTFNSERILNLNTQKRINANDFATNGNKRLLEIFNNEPKEKIISCWQTPIGLPGASGKFIATGNCTITLLKQWLSSSNIKYWLYRDEGTSSQPLSPNSVFNYFNSQEQNIHSEFLGNGFYLFSKE